MDPREPGVSKVLTVTAVKPGSDLGIPSTLENPNLRVYVTRTPYDDFFHLRFFKEGREVTEELEPDETRKWFKDRFAKPLSREMELAREEAIDKALDECWNFGQTWITIPGEVYVEPAKPFPKFQPQI